LFTQPLAYLPGYAVYVAFVFMPGIGLGELLELWDKNDALMEKLALSFGLGLAVDTLALLILTSGFRVGGLSMAGLSLASVYSLIAFGAVALLGSLVYRRKLAVASRPKASDTWLLILMASLAAMEWSYFQKYPIFPQYESVDFGSHVQFVQSLISGTTTSIPSGILYFGVHFQLAAALLVVGGEPIVTLQQTMAILVVLSPLLFYLAGKVLLGRRLAGLVVASLYAFSGTIWFVGIFNSGLYPNFFGILSALFLVVAAVRLAQSVKSAKLWAVFILALVMAYFSHYTTVTVLPALLVLPLLQYFKDRRLTLEYLVPALGAVVPGALGALVYPDLLARALSLAVSGGGVLSGSTALSSALSGFPVLSYMALEVYGDVGFFFLLIFAVVSVYKGYATKRVLAWVPAVWLVALLVAAPRDLSAWRFSYEAMVPLTFMAAYGIFSLLPRLNRGSPRKRARNNFGTLVVLVLLLTPIVATSWTVSAMADAATDTAAGAQAQRSVYSAFYWLKANTSASSGILSATDWRFIFTDAVIGRVTHVPQGGGCFTNPQDVQRAALQSNLTYIIVTNEVTCALPPNPQLFLWNTMHPSSNLTLVYQNDDVKVFQVV
jgi:hypothetical protein